MTDREWVKAFAERIGMPMPDGDQFDAILQLAATAAHASERTAAPVACWVAGVSGKPLSELNQVAETIEGGAVAG